MINRHTGEEMYCWGYASLNTIVRGRSYAVLSGAIVFSEGHVSARTDIGFEAMRRSDMPCIIREIIRLSRALALVKDLIT